MHTKDRLMLKQRPKPQTAPNEEFSAEETAQRRDEVIRRMANTPPQPNGKPKSHHRGKKKRAGQDQRPHKPGRDGKAA
jgi:hypothetical protein